MIRGNVVHYSYGGGQADAFAVWRESIEGKPVGYALVVDGQWRFYGPDGHWTKNRFGLVADERLYESRSGLTGEGRVFVAAPFRWLPVNAIRVDVGIYGRIVRPFTTAVVYRRDDLDQIDVLDGHRFDLTLALVETGLRDNRQVAGVRRVERFWSPVFRRSIWASEKSVLALRVAPGKWFIPGETYFPFILAPEWCEEEERLLKAAYNCRTPLARVLGETLKLPKCWVIEE